MTEPVIAVAEEKNVETAWKTAASFLVTVYQYDLSGSEELNACHVVEEIGSKIAMSSFSDAALFFEKILGTMQKKKIEDNYLEYSFAEERQKYLSFEDGTCFAPGSEFGGTKEAVEQFQHRALSSVPGSAEEAKWMDCLHKAIVMMAQKHPAKAIDSACHFARSVASRETTKPEAMLWPAEVGRIYVKKAQVKGRDYDHETLDDVETSVLNSIRYVFKPNSLEQRQILQVWGEIVLHQYVYGYYPDRVMQKLNNIKNNRGNPPELIETATTLQNIIDPKINKPPRPSLFGFLRKRDCADTPSGGV
ncbi:MAG: hypothetical protein WC464_04350 [Bdellovibrionales bacterium]